MELASGRTITTGGGATGQSISIDGIDEVIKNLRKLGIEADDLKTLNFEAGIMVARKVRPPIDSGDMATTLRVAKATRAAKVNIGNKGKGWYSTFLHYGTKPSEKRKSSVPANPFMLEAKKAALPEIYDHYEKGIDQLIEKYNLGD